MCAVVGCTRVCCCVSVFHGQMSLYLDIRRCLFFSICRSATHRTDQRSPTRGRHRSTAYPDCHHLQVHTNVLINVLIVASEISKRPLNVT